MRSNGIIAALLGHPKGSGGTEPVPCRVSFLDPV
jgi:hypothetical protein